MTGLFCHYLPIYKDKNGVYCSTTLTNDFFSRYFCVVDELIVATRVYSINLTYEEAHQEPITIENVVIEEFPNLSNLRGITLYYRRAKKRIAKLVAECDLIFIRGGIIANMGAAAALKQKKPYLVECAGCAWGEYWNYSMTGKIIAPYMEYMAKKMIRQASHVIYVTEKWLQNRYPTKGVSTYASNVILDHIDEYAIERRIEKISQYPKGKKKYILGTTGGIGNKNKGQQYVIRAMHVLKKKYDLEYQLVGGGNDEYLKNEAKKNNLEGCINFKGQLTHDEVLDWLDSIDLYIQPSMQEGLPRALVEAMSRGCPAVGSTTGGIPELLNAKYIFKRGKVKDLIRVMDYAFSNDMKQAAQDNFIKSREYQIDELNKRRADLYRKYADYVGDNR